MIKMKSLDKDDSDAAAISSLRKHKHHPSHNEFVSTLPDVRPDTVTEEDNAESEIDEFDETDPNPTKSCNSNTSMNPSELPRPDVFLLLDTTIIIITIPNSSKPLKLMRAIMQIRNEGLMEQIESLNEELRPASFIAGNSYGAATVEPRTSDTVGTVSSTDATTGIPKSEPVREVVVHSLRANVASHASEPGGYPCPYEPMKKHGVCYLPPYELLYFTVANHSGG